MEIQWVLRNMGIKGNKKVDKYVKVAPKMCGV